MRKVQLYINNQRVDLFNDEIISLTQTIKNIRDVSKVFTDFSKSFTVPASKSNNKIFQHFQNFFVIGFDSRTKVPARIEIDDVPFREGKIRLDGVELKSNKPYAYKVTFFGDTVTLKDLLGEEKLSALSDLDAFNQTYDNATVKAALQAATSNHVIAPLITHTQRLFYDSGSTTAQTGNLYNSGANHGVAWDQLKYAIRLHKIIEAIESRYGLTFSDDFFSTTNLPYYNLFMWLHRNKGEVTSKDGDQQFTKLIDGWSTTQGGASIMTSSTLFLQSTTLTNLTLTLTRASSTPYNIVITRNDQEVYSQSGIVSGNFVIDLLFTAQPGASYQATISYASAITFSDISWNLVYSGGSDTYATGSFEAPASFEFIITDQIPEIKVIDFLTGLFKMFNLTADLSGSVITVKDLDTYYNEGNIVNITPFIDTESYTVDATTPYREISFKYQDTKAIVAANHNKLTGSEWAQETYNSPDDIKEGETFTVEVPFSHFKYERIVDTSTSGVTDIQWGYGVDSNGDSYIGSPLLFYPINQSHEGILFVDEVDSLGDFTASSSITAPINMPSNSLYFDSATGTQNINFKYEKNEYTRDLAFSGTLFNNYYLNYISSIFNSQRRVSKFKAQLPVSFLLNYSLADTLLISDKEYHINSITTNLNTGQSDLELLNIVDAFYEISGNGDGNGEEPGTLTVSVSGQIAPIEETTYTYNATVGGTAEGTPTYSWSVVGGTINGSNTNSSVSITWNAVEANSPGSVTCTVTKGILDPVSDTLNVTVQNSVAAFTVEVTENGSTTLTTPVTEGDTKAYGVQTTGDTTNVSYTWSIVGGTITSGQGTSSVSVTWDTPTAGGYIQVNAFRDGVTFLDSDRYDIVVNAATPAVTFSIAITNVSSPVLEDSVITYGTTLSGTATGGVSYSWNVVGGSFSGQGTSAITVTWNTPGTGSVRVDATREGVGASDQDSISVTALETTATITGDFSNIIEGNSRSYGSTIGGNTSGAISYSWSASGGTITSGQGTASVSVLWSTPGTATLSLTATRESRSGSDSDSLTILPIYYIFNACDGGTTVIDRLTTAPSATNQRYIDFSTSPDATYYTYSGFTQNDSSGYPIVDLQAATPFATGCPEPEPIPLSELSITGATNISGSGQSGVQYTLNVDPNTVSWQLSDAALSGFNPIDITFVTSTSGTGDSTFTVNYGAYDGNGSETLRSQITATELNPAPGNAAASGSITISQSPPPTATLNVYARANLVTASRTFEYSLGGAYTPIATANITQSCSLIGTVTGITPGATVTLTTSPQNQLLGNNTSTCPGDFTSPSGATTYSITVAAGTNNVALNVDTVSGTFALTVARSLIDGATACSRYASGATGTSYFDGASLQGSTAVFADVNGYEYATPAWYSDGLDFRYWNGTSFTSEGVCSGGSQV